MKCRQCGATLELPLIDLGSAPPSNAYLTESSLKCVEKWFPLKVLVCTHCWLAQTEDYTGRDELFTAEYAYFSSFSTTWLRHAEAYVESMVDRFTLGAESFVVEVAANDGYLLQFVRARGIPCLGVEPTGGTATVARQKGIEIVEEFFGSALADRMVAEGRKADLVVANNVLAHVPDINDFVLGFARLLKPQGVATFEFPHLLRLVEESQFDTIYHEHFSYLSLTAIIRVFERNGLSVFDVEELLTHGGSLRVFVQHQQSAERKPTDSVHRLLAREAVAGITSREFYGQLQPAAERIKNDLLAFLIEINRAGKRIAGYGAAAKGNTLLNFAGVRPDLLPWVADRNPAKQGRFLPGSRIPIVDAARIDTERPDYLLVLPWNLKEEIMEQLSHLQRWGGRFVTAVPALEIS